MTDEKTRNTSNVQPTRDGEPLLYTQADWERFVRDSNDARATGSASPVYTQAEWDEREERIERARADGPPLVAHAIDAIECTVNEIVAWVRKCAANNAADESPNAQRDARAFTFIADQIEARAYTTAPCARVDLECGRCGLLHSQESSVCIRDDGSPRCNSCWRDDMVAAGLRPSEASSGRKQEVIEQLCKMMGRAYNTVDPNAHEPCDCVCDQKLASYQNAGHALTFMEEAISEAIARRERASGDPQTSEYWRRWGTRKTDRERDRSCPKPSYTPSSSSPSAASPPSSPTTGQASDNAPAADPGFECPYHGPQKGAFWICPTCSRTSDTPSSSPTMTLDEVQEVIDFERKAERDRTIDECASIAQERVSAGFHWTDIPRRIRALKSAPFTPAVPVKP